MEQKHKKYEDDDGRVIVNMDVEGMRWHDRRIRRERTVGKSASRSEQLSRSEAWRYTWYSVLAGLSIVMVFSATWVLFVLFCIKVWFR